VSGDHPVRIILVGCGAMGEQVARRVYARADDDRYTITAVVDSRPERAAAVSGLLGVPGHRSVADAMASGVPVDAVDLRVPHDAHADAAVDALRGGLHVLVEKPLATTLADGQRIRAAAVETGRVVAVAENYPHLLAVRAAVQDESIGELRALRTTRAYTLGGVWLRDGWRTGSSAAGGILLDQGTHHMSLLRQFGEIVAVNAQSTPRRDPADIGETVLLTAWFASGLVGQSLYSWGTPEFDGDVEGTVYGSTARIDIRVSYKSTAGQAVRFDDAVPDGRVISQPENYYDSHRLIIEDWVTAIRDNRDPLVGVDEALADLRAVVAAQTSLAEERTVRLAELAED
jgi:UDP-N-acetyl-2-amino-2-deoxyglucuronate dehydrogenase